MQRTSYREERRAVIALIIAAGFLPVGVGWGQSQSQVVMDRAPVEADRRADHESKTDASATSEGEGTPKVDEGERLTAADPVEFFRQHFFPFEPFYFIAGTESPNAKFQISLRYQLFIADSWVAKKWSGVTNFSVAYTQTSLWDWNGPSAPFFDSSYKPEFNYTWLHVDRGRWADWFRLDLQGGLQHESNGKGGADSRSLNLVYLRPTVTFGRVDHFQVSLSPKAFAYLGDLSDNPDLADYRGYVELRTVLGWSDNVQLAATGRVGEGFDHGSLQLDLTYPMWKLPVLRASVFLHAQYFTGYGESLLRYNERSDIFRAGFALFR
jgi:outer membrane phospholipase A